jgi:hypothetical protein
MIGATLDNSTGLLEITDDQLANLRPLHFNIGPTTLELDANAQLWPHNLNTQVGGNAHGNYLIVSDLGNHTRPGLRFIMGMVLLYVFFPSAISMCLIGRS